MSLPPSSSQHTTTYPQQLPTHPVDLPGLTAAVVPARSKCKLYRFDPAGQEWKERGVGMAKLLKHKENQRIRLLMRQDKTLKIRANHLGRFGLEWDHITLHHKPFIRCLPATCTDTACS